MMEIVMSGNASTYGVECMVKDYVSRFENVSYFKNPKNYYRQKLSIGIK